jgi:hypothetical protein
MSGQWNSQLFDPTCKYIVVDDMALDNHDMFQHYKQVIGCQREFEGETS